MDSRQINTLEQMLIAKVFNFWRDAGWAPLLRKAAIAVACSSHIDTVPEKHRRGDAGEHQRRRFCCICMKPVRNRLPRNQLRAKFLAICAAKGLE
jgi:hypothetical protein